MRAGGMPQPRSTAAWASTPSASTARRLGMPCSSPTRKRLQAATSAGSGRLAGGTQRTELAMRVSLSVSPSSIAAA